MAIQHVAYISLLQYIINDPFLLLNTSQNSCAITMLRMHTQWLQQAHLLTNWPTSIRSYFQKHFLYHFFYILQRVQLIIKQHWFKEWLGVALISNLKLKRSVYLTAKEIAARQQAITWNGDDQVMWVRSQRCSSQIARFMGPTWGPPGADRTQVGPMLARWTLLSGLFCYLVLLSGDNKTR